MVSKSGGRSEIKDYTKYIVKIVAQELFINWRLPFSIESSRQAIGTGFFIDSHGLILTCGHVLEKSIKIFVEIPSEGFRRYDAEIIGFCPSDQLDIGLIRIKGYRSKHYLKLGDSDKMKHGMKTIVIGFPLGQSYLKFTEGIISGFQNGTIQTDTPINSGNSGGPLIYNGKVIGIIIAKIINAENIGYAVPINQFKAIADNLIDAKNKGKIVRKPVIGIEYSELTDGMKKHFKYNKGLGEGTYVSYIYNGSPISRTGIKVGSILQTFDGISVDNFGLVKFNDYGNLVIDDYCKFIGIGKPIVIKWWNHGKTHHATFRFTSFLLPIDTLYPVYEKMDYIIIGGLVLTNLKLNYIRLYPTQLMKYLYDPHECIGEKVIVANIMAGSNIARYDILTGGDIITKVNGIPVRNIRDIRGIIELGVSDLVIENEAGKVLVVNYKEAEKATQDILAVYKGKI
jgi:serine protease Do